jgi:sugar phosphate isomerase/epimerase
MHMHDAKAPTKDHLALGDGDLDIPFYRELARKNDCTVVLETKTLKALSESAAWLKEKNLFV